MLKNRAVCHSGFQVLFCRILKILRQPPRHWHGDRDVPGLGSPSHQLQQGHSTLICFTCQMECHLNKKSYSLSGKNKGTSYQLQLASRQVLRSSITWPNNQFNSLPESPPVPAILPILCVPPTPYFPFLQPLQTTHNSLNPVCSRIPKCLAHISPSFRSSIINSLSFITP